MRQEQERRELSTWAFFAILAAALALVAGVLVWSSVDLDRMISRLFGVPPAEW